MNAALTQGSFTLFPPASLYPARLESSSQDCHRWEELRQRDAPIRKETFCFHAAGPGLLNKFGQTEEQAADRGRRHAGDPLKHTHVPGYRKAQLQPDSRVDLETTQNA